MVTSFIHCLTRQSRVTLLKSTFFFGWIGEKVVKSGDNKTKSANVEKPKQKKVFVILNTFHKGEHLA